MHRDQVVDHGADFRDAQRAGGMAVQHGGAIDTCGVAVQRGAHRQFLHEDMRRTMCGQLRRQFPNAAGTQTIAVNHHGHVDAAIFRQIVDQTCVVHAAVDQRGLVGQHGVDDARAVSLAGVQRQLLAGEGARRVSA